MALTPKQERFAQEVASGKTQADAYRAAFNVREGTKADSVIQNASRLMANSNISSRVEELRKPIAKKAQITLESHLEALEKIRDAAYEAKQYSAATSAEIARGKASGVHVERSELTGKDGGPIQHAINAGALSDATLKELLNARRAQSEQ